MAMSVADLQAIDALLAGADLEKGLIAALRRQFPHLSWTGCDASDVTDTPFRIYEYVDIHLLNSTDHCAQLTSDLASATGVILAKRSAEHD
ncbi:MAG: hypothetical protein PHT60_05250 [Acidiphilium sp.]|nr:hypothetical protein [Acidiphilium sp.]MDD4935170.1 hypothetical protein [Acidiphilium sp.]